MELQLTLVAYVMRCKTAAELVSRKLASNSSMHGNSLNQEYDLLFLFCTFAPFVFLMRTFYQFFLSLSPRKSPYSSFPFFLSAFPPLSILVIFFLPLLLRAAEQREALVA